MALISSIISPEIVSLYFGEFGSLLITVILLVTFPLKEPDLKVALISPVLSGGIVFLVNITAVHPQEVFTLLISKISFPRFSNLNTCSAVCPLNIFPKLKSGFSKKITGCWSGILVEVFLLLRGASALSNSVFVMDCPTANNRNRNIFKCLLLIFNLINNDTKRGY